MRAKRSERKSNVVRKDSVGRRMDSVDDERRPEERKIPRWSRLRKEIWRGKRN